MQASSIYPRVVISRKESTCGLRRSKTSKAVLSPAWIAPSTVPGQFLAYSLEVNKILWILEELESLNDTRQKYVQF